MILCQQCQRSHRVNDGCTSVGSTCVCVRARAGCAVKDYGNLTFAEPPSDDPVGKVKCAWAVGGANQRLSEAVQAVKMDGHTSVMLGGDHR